jgi:hypothetical protein
MKNRWGCLAVLMLLGLGAFGAYRVFSPPPIGGVPFRELPPATQKVRRAEAQKLVEEVKKVAQAAKKPGKKPFTISATEEQLNTLLQDRIKIEKLPVRDLRVGLSPGVLQVQGRANYQGFEVPATLSGTLRAQDGALQFQIDSLQLGGLPAPGEVRERAQKAIGDGLSQAFARDSKTRIDAVKVEAKKLTIQGQTG